jgi:predicted enzyme related to lactoylglutathione lyase
MARVLGVGGVFFKATDREKLAEWYEKWLSVPLQDNASAMFKPTMMPEAGFTVWGPFEQSTDYFAPSTKDFMINFVVDDLDGALRQVQEGGGRIADEIQEYAYGRFGWFVDPDGNKIELWEPR